MLRSTLFQVLGLTILIAIGAFAFSIWSPPPDLSNLESAGDSYDVHILRDSWGVPHIFGKRDTDVAYGLAYAHAEDDFLTIQQTILVGRGKLATAYGSNAAPTDYLVQLLRVWDVVEEHFETDLSPEMRTILKAYADGLNYYAALHSGDVLTHDLFPVSSKDLVAYSVFQLPLFYDLDKEFTKLFTDERQSELSGSPSAFINFDTDYGSNTFSIGPSRTDDGSTYLAVNSHQPWEGATTWYEAHLHSEQGWDISGATFPTTPAIILGHNRYLGWAFTVNHPDLADVYVLTMNPKNENEYLFDGEWRQLEVRNAPIEVKLVGNMRITIKQEVLWSIYGPTVRTDHGTYAIRYAGYGRVDIFEQLYHMNKATNFNQWRSAMEIGAIPNFNVGYGDTEGNIYYLYNAMMPIRTEGYNWSLYLPGDTSDTLWSEYLPFDDLPQVLNPPSGFIQNANSTPFQTTLGPGNPDPAAYSETMGIETSMTNRALRALEQFGSDESITFSEFMDYKYDRQYSINSDISNWIEMLLQWAPPNDKDIQDALDVLRDWDLEVNTYSPAPTLIAYTIYHLLEDEQPINPSHLVGSQVSQQALIEAFRKAVTHLEDNFGSVLVPWGQANRLMRGDVDLALSGGLDLLHAIYGRLGTDGRFVGFQGDSFIQLVRFDPSGEIESYSIHQYGTATLVPQSPHYSDQSHWFASRRLKPVWFDEAEIRANLEREYQPGDDYPGN